MTRLGRKDAASSGNCKVVGVFFILQAVQNAALAKVRLNRSCCAVDLFTLDHWLIV